MRVSVRDYLLLVRLSSGSGVAIRVALCYSAEARLPVVARNMPDSDRRSVLQVVGLGVGVYLEVEFGEEFAGIRSAEDNEMDEVEGARESEPCVLVEH